MSAKSASRRAAVIAATLVLIATGPASPRSLTVPFFRDDGGLVRGNFPETGAAGIILVKNTRDMPVTMYLVYAQNGPNGEAALQSAGSYTIDAKDVVYFRPLADDPFEGRGRDVPNLLPGLGAVGSVQLIWIGGDDMKGALIGHYKELVSGSSMMYVLVED